MKKNFLKRVCPFRVLEEKVTWGEFIALYIKGAIGAVGLFAYYILFIVLADSIRVID